MTPEAWPEAYLDNHEAPLEPIGRLRKALRSLPKYDLADPNRRELLWDVCFRIICLCDQIEHDERPVPVSVDYHEPNLVRELVGLSDNLHHRQAIAFTRDRASVLEALLGRR